MKKMKRYAILVMVSMVLVLCFSMVTAFAAAGGVGTIITDKDTYAPGDIITVTIHLDNVASNITTNAASIKLRYDNASLELATPSTPADSFISTYIPWTTKKLTKPLGKTYYFAEFGYTVMTGGTTILEDTDIGKVQFRVKSTVANGTVLPFYFEPNNPFYNMGTTSYICTSPYVAATPLTVTVATAPVAKKVTAVNTVVNKTVDAGTAFDALGLPANVEVTLDDGTTDTLPVTWAQGSYDASKAATYTIAGTLGTKDGIDNNGQSATATVIVNDIAPTGVTLDKDALTLIANGAAAKLNATIVPPDATNPAVTWTSSNTDVATVANDGTVTPKAVGTATITVASAADPTLTDTCEVTVVDAPVATLTGRDTIVKPQMYALANYIYNASITFNGASVIADQAAWSLTKLDGTALDDSNISVSASANKVIVTIKRGAATTGSFKIVGTYLGTTVEKTVALADAISISGDIQYNVGGEKALANHPISITSIPTNSQTGLAFYRVRVYKYSADLSSTEKVYEKAQMSQQFAFTPNGAGLYRVDVHVRDINSTEYLDDMKVLWITVYPENYAKPELKTVKAVANADNTVSITTELADPNTADVQYKYFIKEKKTDGTASAWEVVSGGYIDAASFTTNALTQGSTYYVSVYVKNKYASQYTVDSFKVVLVTIK